MPKRPPEIMLLALVFLSVSVALMFFNGPILQMHVGHLDSLTREHKKNIPGNITGMSTVYPQDTHYIK